MRGCPWTWKRITPALTSFRHSQALGAFRAARPHAVDILGDVRADRFGWVSVTDQRASELVLLDDPPLG
jgi:hypothetical protein